MRENVEIKARVDDLGRVRGAVEALGARPAGRFEQVDRYYELEGGRRVKLRTSGAGRVELIRYDRPETSGVRLSRYEVTPVRDGGQCLVPKSEPLVTVRKRRELWLLENVRIHLDEVDGLGCFLELEAAVDEDHEEVQCRRQVDAITDALGIDEGAFVRASYSDLVR